MDLNELEARYRMVEARVDSALKLAAQTRFTAIIVAVVAAGFFCLGWKVRGW